MLLCGAIPQKTYRFVSLYLRKTTRLDAQCAEFRPIWCICLPRIQLFFGICIPVVASCVYFTSRSVNAVISLNAHLSSVSFTCNLPVLPAVWRIDNCWNMAEGRRTQIKRAYELSVCRRNALTDTRIASTGCLAFGVRIDGNVCVCRRISASDAYCSASISWRSVDDLRR